MCGNDGVNGLDKLVIDYKWKNANGNNLTIDHMLVKDRSSNSYEVINDLPSITNGLINDEDVIAEMHIQPLDKNMSIRDYLSQSIQGLIEYQQYLKANAGKVGFPKYIIDISHLAFMSKRFGFDLADLTSDQVLKSNAYKRVLNPENYNIWKEMRLKFQAFFSGDKTTEYSDYMMYKKMFERFEPNNVQLSYVPTNDFLNIDFSKRLPKKLEVGQVDSKGEGDNAPNVKIKSNDDQALESDQNSVIEIDKTKVEQITNAYKSLQLQLPWLQNINYEKIGIGFDDQVLEDIEFIKENMQLIEDIPLAPIGETYKTEVEGGTCEIRDVGDGQIIKLMKGNYTLYPALYIKHLKGFIQEAQDYQITAVLGVTGKCYGLGRSADGRIGVVVEKIKDMKDLDQGTGNKLINFTTLLTFIKKTNKLFDAGYTFDTDSGQTGVTPNGELHFFDIALVRSEGNPRMTEAHVMQFINLLVPAISNYLINPRVIVADFKNLFATIKTYLQSLYVNKANYSAETTQKLEEVMKQREDLDQE